MEKYNDTWTKIFPESMLEEGWTYYRQGKAKKLTFTEYGYIVRVRGRRNYLVEVFINMDNELEGADCDCERGVQGYWCKHIAAALYYIDDKSTPISGLSEEYFEIEESEESPDHSGESFSRISGGFDGRSWISDLNQLQKEESSRYLLDNGTADSAAVTEEYRYFHFEDFRKGLDLSKSVLKEAREILDKGELTNINVEVGFPNRIGETGMMGIVSGTEKYGYQNVIINFNRYSIFAGYCNIWDCRYQKSSKSVLGHRFCKHETALLLYLEDYLKKNNPGDASNASAIRLFHTMKQTGSRRTSDKSNIKAEQLELVPVLHYSRDKGLTVTFKVGAGRLYVIKDLSEFVEHVRNNLVMRFGKKTEFQLGKAYIVPAHLPILDFIEHVLAEDEQLRTKLRYQESLPALSGEISLYGNNLDELFDAIGENHTVEFIRKGSWGNKKDKYDLLLQTGDFQASFAIRQDVDEDSGEFQGIRFTGQLPEFFYGQKYAYTIDDLSLCRIPREKTRDLELLLDAQQSGEINIRVGRNHLADFYRNVLPRFRKVSEIEENDVEVISQYLPLDPVFLCYLDILDDQMICRVDVAYGNKLHSLVEDFVKGNVIMNYRDIDRETEFMDFLYQYFPHMDHELMVFFGNRDEESVYEFLENGLADLLDTAEVHMTDRFRRLGIRRSIKYNLGVSVETNVLDLDLVSSDHSREELLDILKAYKRRARFIRLRNGDFLKVDQNESVAILSELMDSLHVTPKEFVKGKMHIPAYRALYLEKMMEQSRFIEADRSKAFRRLIREFDTATNADYDLPETLDPVLRNYQREGYQWLRTLDHLGFGGILADEMGLGKTLQVITVLLAAKQENHLESDTSLIVCPASLVYNWKEELARFAPELSCGMVAGTKTQRRQAISGYQIFDVLVTSYDLLKRDIDEYENKVFRFMILDEAQYIKNQQTAAARSVKLIMARTRYALTGTPIEKRLSDMWSIFDYLMPGFLYEYSVFRREYEQPIVKNGEKELTERLARMTSPFILRRKKMDVLKDLPEKLEEIRYAAMERTQQKLYDASVVRLRKSLKKQDDEEFKRNRIQVLSELTRLRQLCCDPSLYYQDYDGGSAKREACMSLVESIVEGEHKALIFSQFTTMLELLEKDLAEAGIPYYKITGATPKEKRIHMVKAFNMDRTPVFLISLKAGGTGLNLTGADVVIHYDPWWNLAVQNQATDRAHRIGQEQIVTVYKLIIKGTIEEKIIKMQEAKKKLAEDILDTENISSANISREDLLALLE